MCALVGETTHSFLFLNPKVTAHLREKKITILTLIKNCFKRYVWEELVDFPQDICFVSKSCISIPDLYNIFPVTNANTDTNNLIIWEEKKTITTEIKQILISKIATLGGKKKHKQYLLLQNT